MFKSLLKIIAIGVVTISGFNGLPCPEEDWSTTLDTKGSCVSIKDCPSLLALLGKTDGLEDDEKETLRKSQCGLDGNVPKVCCPRVTQGTITTSKNQAIMLTSASAASPSPPNVTNHPNLGLINKNNCGDITETRIIPGPKASIFEYPWMAIILYTVNDNAINELKCEGTLINERYVLTAAHCVTGLDPGVKLSAVILGDYDLNSEIDCVEEHQGDIICADKYQRFSIHSFHIHEEYDPQGADNYRNDIALIRIDGEADFNTNNVKPICLPIARDGDGAMMKFEKVTVTGWGKTDIRSPSLSSSSSTSKSRFLMRSTDEIIPEAECEKIYKKINNTEISLHKQFCAGGKNRPTCPGDDGGPSQYPATVDNYRKFVQHGILAFGPNCDDSASRSLPNVYTQVSHYLDWILDTIH